MGVIMCTVVAQRLPLHTKVAKVLQSTSTQLSRADPLSLASSRVHVVLLLMPWLTDRTRVRSEADPNSNTHGPQSQPTLLDEALPPARRLLT